MLLLPVDMTIGQDCVEDALFKVNQRATVCFHLMGHNSVVSSCVLLIKEKDRFSAFC